MARLLDWPVGLMWVSADPLSGPRARGAGQNESVSGFVQTFSSPFGLWRWQFVFPPLRHKGFSSFRGLVTGLHAGANAVRVPFCDPDGLSYADAGLAPTRAQWRDGVPWSDGQTWDGRRRWRLGRPPVALADPTPLGETIVQLAPMNWGARLEVGAMIGFGPQYFGMHVVTEVLAPGAYRIWPGLRKAMTIADFATLSPVLAMRMTGESDASLTRGAVNASAPSLTLLEVPDGTVRTAFAD